MNADPLAELAPDSVTETFRALWKGRWNGPWDGHGPGYEVTPCPYSASELKKFSQQGRRVGFLPRELATRESRSILGEIFPAMRDFSLLAHTVCVNQENPWGWFDYEAAIDAPRTGLDEAETLAELASEDQTLLSLNQYIVASQDSKHFVGRYLDEVRTWTRVGLYIDGRMMAVRFDGDEMAIGLGDEPNVPGRLISAYDVKPAERGPVLGSRTSTMSTHRQVVDSSEVDVSELPSITAAALFRPIETLDAEWSRIAAAYVDRGYHAELGMDEDDYLASLPRFAGQEPSDIGRFDVPLIVETRIPWKRLATLAGLRLSAVTLASTYKPRSESATPRPEPYSAWFAWWGRRFREPIAGHEAYQALTANEVGGNMHELVAMEVAHPELNANALYWEAIGYVDPPHSMVGLDSPSTMPRTPCTWRPRDVSEIAVSLNPIAYSIMRPLVRRAELHPRSA